jgi:hypothetical protein
VAPVLVRIQPDGELDSVVCSRPIAVPRRKIPNVASPGAGVAGGCAEAVTAASTNAAAAPAVQ